MSGEQKDMSKKLLSKPNVMSSSGIMYACIYKKKIWRDSQNLQQLKSRQ